MRHLHFKLTEEDGNYKSVQGLTSELGKYFAEELGVEPQFVEMDFEECLKAAKEKEPWTWCCLVCCRRKTGRACVDFSDAYYEPGKQVLVARKSQSRQIS